MNYGRTNIIGLERWLTFSLIVERRQLNTACPHRYRVEVGRVYSHAGRVGPHQMTHGMSEERS